MFEEKEDARRAVVLGALLDGVDACRRVLRQNTGAPPLGEEWREQLAQCCDAQILAAPETDALIRRAERLAAGGEVAATPATPAVSPVFDTIKREAAPRRFPLTPLTATPDAYLAARTDSPRPAEIAAHGAALERALEQVRQQVRWHDFDCVYSYLLHVLQVFGWCLPAAINTEGANDVSIYNHARSSAAIAACLPAAGDLESPFCALVKGDISGTQDFLYLMTSAGAARGLRGRSFYLQLLGETIARWVLRQFGLPDANLLFVGGGHFYLLLPAEELKSRLDELRKSIAEKLWRAHQGDLSLAMGCVELTAGDFEGGFAEKWAGVSRVTNEAKQRKWIELGGEAMMQSLFTPRQRGTTAEQMCQVCRGEYDEAASDRKNNEVRRCRRCEGFEDLGRRLRHASHLVTFSVPDGAPPANAQSGSWREILESFGASVHLLDKTSDTPVAPVQAASARVELLQPGGFADRFRWDGLPTGYGVRLLADATPIKATDEIADFKDLAAAADGVKWLGVLRMDVDDLGRVFSEGREKLGGRATIARMSALSESLRWFFEGRVARVCRNQNRFGEGDKDRVYLIHAGGDDLFVVGAWSALPPLASAIREEFRALVGGDHVTLSAGIAIQQLKYPLYQLAADARRALEDGAKACRPEKNAICFLQKPIGWKQFNRADRWHEELMEMLTDKRQRMPRAILSRLGEIHAIHEENARRQERRRRTGQITMEEMREERHFAQWQWRLVYHLERFGRRHPGHREKIEEFQQEITRPEGGDGRLISLLRVIARWTELQTRESNL